MHEINFISIREEGNYAEQFNCKRFDDKFLCAYVKNGQIQNNIPLELLESEMDAIIKGCIGYFPKGKMFLDIIVDSYVFSELIVRMNIAYQNN